MNQYFPLQNNFFLSLNWSFTSTTDFSIHHKETRYKISFEHFSWGNFVSLLANTALQTSGFGMFIVILESLYCFEKMLFKNDFLKNKPMQYWCIVVAAVCHFVFIQVSDKSLFYLLNICQLNDSFTQKHWPKFKFIGCSWKQ